MGQLIEYGPDARNKIYEGIKKVNNAVKVTLGPMGRRVIISQLYHPHYDNVPKALHVTKDGVTTARSISLIDPFENIGQRLVQEAAQKSVDMSGDGTTTTTVLLEALVRHGLELLKKGSAVNPQDLKKGIDEAVLMIIDALKERAVAIGDDDIEKIRQIATVSANNDQEIGDLIAEAFKEIGREGVIDIQQSVTDKTYIKTADGFKIDSGFIAPHFKTNEAKNECELINPVILLYEKNILKLEQIKPSMDIALREGRPLLVICEDCEMQALAILIMNKLKGILPACVVKSPFMGERRTQVMEDVAAFTGGTYMMNTKGTKLENITKAHLGNAEKVIITKDSTVIIGGQKGKLYEDLVNELKTDLHDHNNKTEDEKADAEKRIARLKGGVAVIHVGAPTETEMKEKIDRVDDAVRATKAAIAEGYLPGGGAELVKFTEIKSLGEMVVLKALKEPLSQICRNAGVDEVEILKSVENAPVGHGYNAKTGTVENLIEAGIIDPLKVVRCALQNAASVAGNLLIAEAVITDTPN